MVSMKIAFITKRFHRMRFAVSLFFNFIAFPSHLSNSKSKFTLNWMVSCSIKYTNLINSINVDLYNKNAWSENKTFIFLWNQIERKISPNGRHGSSNAVDCLCNLCKRGLSGLALESRRFTLPHCVVESLRPGGAVGLVAGGVTLLVTIVGIGNAWQLKFIQFFFSSIKQYTESTSQQKI